MKKTFFGILVIFFVSVVSLSAQTTANTTKVTTVQVKDTLILISTTLGDIKVKLYNDTPLHRNNFIKLVKQGFYNGSIFHRVIKGFMIQGGSTPGSGGAGDCGKTFSAEIKPNHFHKKGALCAARTNNPKKESSCSQFYIVQGKVYTDMELNSFGKPISVEARKAYKTVGGTPHLDGEYTVFGEVIEGLDVVDKIAAVKTLPGDKPETEVKMTMKFVQK